MSDMGSKIKELRVIKNFSQQDLAEKLGVKQNTVSQYENNVKRPSYEILIQLSNILEVSTDYLLGKEEF